VGKNDTIKKRTAEKQDRFLKAYSIAGTVTTAAIAAGIHRDTPYRWNKNDTNGFAKRFVDAQAEFSDHIESVAFERVRSGQGSDLLLITLLNAHIPEKYRANRRRITDNGIEVIKKLTHLSRQVR
jgi:hypothetical protein